MITYNFSSTTFQLLSTTDAETWVVGDALSKTLKLAFTGITATNVFDYACRVVITRPDLTASNNLVLSENSAGYYTLVIPAWVCEQEGNVTFTVKTWALSTPTVITTYGTATKAVSAGTPAAADTITNAQYVTLGAAIDACVLETAKKHDFADIVTTTAEGVATKDTAVDSSLKTNEKIAVVEVAKSSISAMVGTVAEESAGITKNTEYYSVLKTQELIAANGVDDKAYTDSEIDKVEDGTYTADKATKDASGNNIINTYATKNENNARLPMNGSGAMTGTLNMGSNRIISLSDGASNSDGATVGQMNVAIQNAVSAVYRYKGSVSTYAGLAAKEGTAVSGDVWKVLADETSDDTNVNYAWDGSAWNDLGSNESLATALADGLMSKEDYAKLSGIASDTEARLAVVELASTDHGSRLDIAEPKLATAETDIDTLQSNDSTQDGQIAVLQNLVAAETLDSANENLSRQQPTATLEKSAPTTAAAHKTHNMNGLKTDGATIKNYLKDSNLSASATHPNYELSNMTLTVEQNIGRLLSTAQNGRVSNYATTTNRFASRVVYIGGMINSPYVNVKIYANWGTDQASISYGTTYNSFVSFGAVVTVGATATSLRIVIQDEKASAWSAVYFKNLHLVDLTELGTHPTLGVAWNTLTAEALATYIGKLAFTGTTSGLHSATPDEVLVKGTTPNQVELKRFSGRTVKEMALNPDFAAALSATDWVAADCGTPTVSGSKITLTATAQNGGISQTLTTISGNKYYVVALVKASSANVKLVGTNPTSSAAHTGGGAFELLHFVMTANNTTSVITLRDENASDWAAVECYYIQFIALTGVGIAHITTPTEAAAYYNISTATLTAYAFGLTNSIPTAIVTKDGSAVQIASYAMARAEWPTAQQTYGMPCLPCGIADYIDGRTAKYWRNIGIEIFDGDAGENWAYNSTGTLCMTFVLASGLPNSLLVQSDGTTALSNRFVQKSNVTAGDEEYFRCTATATTLYVSILRTRIGSPADGAPALAAFKSWLNTNNLIVQYLRTATDHDLTSPTTFRLNALAAGTIEITGALNPTTCFDLGEYYSHATDISAIGELAALPSGIKSGFETKVDDNPLSTTFQDRIYQFVKRAKTLSLPTDAQANGWAKLTATEMVLNGIDWTDTNSDGLADNWTMAGSGATASIVSGKQRMASAGAGALAFQTISLVEGHKYLVALDLTVSSKTVSVGTGIFLLDDVATGLTTGSHSIIFTAGATSDAITFMIVGSASGDYYELDNVSVKDITSLYATGISTTGLSAFLLQATNSVWEIDLSYWDGGSTLTLPASCADVANAYISDTNRPHVALNTLITGGAIGVAISPNSKLYFVTTNAVADTLAELYTYLLANLPKVVIGITAETTNVPINYIPMCGDNSATVVITSSTVAEASDWEAVVPTDLNAILAAL